MMKQKQINKIAISFLLIAIVIIIAFEGRVLTPGIYFDNYIVNSVSLIISLLILFSLYVSEKIDIFSPLVFFSLIYLTMFFVTPMRDIIKGNIEWYGVNLFDYGVKGSVYALLGYISFCIVYISVNRKKRVDVHYSPLLNKNITSSVSKKRLLPFIITGYFVCLFANIIYLKLSGGSSLLYILTLGLFGSANSSATVVDIGAISMLSYALPSFTLLYFEYGNSKICKFLFFALMYELQVARGFRFFIIQIAVMFGSYYCIKRCKKPKIITIVLLSTVILIPLLLMTIFRNSIRDGSGIEVSLLSRVAISEALDETFWDNLRIYKNYYAIIKVVPALTPYLHGKQMIIYTAIMFIPRAIWSGKPGNPGTQAQMIALGKTALIDGSAYPGLAEYYYEFGLFGVIFWMGMFGFFVKKVEDKYRNYAKSSVDQMVYCTILGSILQLIIRGYTPSNLWMVVFCVMPYWLLKRIYKVN